MGDGVYAGGGSFDGTVNAFMPGRSERRLVDLRTQALAENLPGRLVAGDGLVRGLGLLRPILLSDDVLTLRLPGLEGSGVMDLVVETEELLFLRPSLRSEPNTERRCECMSVGMAESSGANDHAEATACGIWSKGKGEFTRGSSFCLMRAD